MLGILSLLPLLKGWDYKKNIWRRVVKRGENSEAYRVEDFGFLLYAAVGSDDAYGGFSVEWQGADLSILKLGTINADFYWNNGAIAQDPGGFVSRYYRPNTESTAGVYYSVLTSMGFQGSTWPHVPTTIVTLRLEEQSTQPEALIEVNMLRMIITNRTQFIKSLRALLGTDLIQDIDPALLSAGTQEITQKGIYDKEK